LTICGILNCINEVLEGGDICSSCEGMLSNREEFIPLMCWECMSIVNIYYREGIVGDSIDSESPSKRLIGDSIFCHGCRGCKDKKDEKEGFIFNRL